MKEVDIQNYLYEHPEFLFPNKVIQEKAKEYLIKGKRIDLLFRVDGVRYIVEIKNTAIKRDHIGQIVEYYGLMKEYLNEANLKMILVAPSIEKWQKTYLEELGIRCVEFDKMLSDDNPNITKPPLQTNNLKEDYWVVFSDKIDLALDKIQELKNNDLKNLFLFEDSYVNLFSFPLDSKRYFVRGAKVNDYVLGIYHKIDPVTVIPFRRIIKIEENQKDKFFFLEARESEKKSYLSYNAFNDRLLNIDKNISVGSKSVRRLKSDEIVAIKSVFENFKISQRE
jgi:hypothetical protein